MLLVLEAENRASAALDSVRDKLLEVGAAAKVASDEVSGAGRHIDESMARTAVASDALKHAENDAGSAAKDTSKDADSLGDSLKGAGEKANESAGFIRKWSLIVGAAAAPLSGALLAALPLAFMGVGIMAEKSDKQVVAAFDSMKKSITSTLQTAFAPIVPVLTHVMGQIGSTFKSLAPAFHEIASAIAPMIQLLGNGLMGALRVLVPAFAGLMHTLTPVVSALSQGLVTIAHGLAGLFANLNVGAAAQGLKQLFNAVGEILPVLGRLLSALSPLSNVILSTLVPALGHLIVTVGSTLAPVLRSITPIVKPIAGTIVALAQTFGQLITAALPLVKPLLSIVSAVTNLDTPLEAVGSLLGTVAKTLAPLLGIVAQIANLVADALNTALTDLATALTPLIPPLGQLAGAILTALLQVLQAIEPVLPSLVGAFTRLIPPVVQLIPPLTQIVRDATPIAVVLAKIGATIATFLLGTLGKLGPLLHDVVVGFLLFKGVQQLVGVFKMVGTAWKVLSALFMSNPWLALAAAVVAIALLIITHWKTVSAFLTSVWHGIVDVAKVIWNGLKDFFTHLWHDIENIFTTVVHSVVGVIKGWYPLILGVLSGGVLALPALIFKYWRQITHYVSEAWTDAINWLEGVPGKITHLFANAGKWLWDAGKDIIHGLWQGIESAVGGLMNDISGIGGKIVGGFKSVLSIFSPSRVMADEVGKYIPLGIAKGITDNLGAISAATQLAGRHAVAGAQLGLSIGGGVSALSPAASVGTTVIFAPDLRGSQVMSDRDMDSLVTKLGSALTKRIIPQGGTNLRFRAAGGGV